MDGNIAGQDLVEAEYKIEAWRFLQHDVAEIVASVHPRIRAPAPDAVDLAAKDARQGVLQRFLHGGFARLPLPTVVVRTFVGEVEEELHFGVKSEG